MAVDEPQPPYGLSYTSPGPPLFAIYSANPGNPALCLQLIKENATATCGTFGEDTAYLTPSGQTIQGTRSGLGTAFANDDYDASVGNSNYNAFEATLRHSTKNLTFLIGYTYSKSIDQASSISDPGNPYDLSATRALSSFDLTQNFVASYQYKLPFDRWFSHAKGLT